MKDNKSFDIQRSYSPKIFMSSDPQASSLSLLKIDENLSSSEKRLLKINSKRKSKIFDNLQNKNLSKNDFENSNPNNNYFNNSCPNNFSLIANDKTTFNNNDNYKNNSENNFFESEKIKEIFYLALPTTLFFACLFLQETINLSFIGHLIKDKKEKENALNALGIAHIYVNCLIVAIITGLVSGFDTLGSNAFGVKNFKLLGLYLQRGQIICYIVLSCLLIFHYFFAFKILALFSLKQPVLIIIEKYIYILFLFSLVDIQFAINFRYLNVIDKTHFNLIFLLITLILHPLWCYLFMIHFADAVGIIQGAGLALVISQLINVCLGSFYIYIINPLPESIFCFGKLSFMGWGNYLKISVPAAFLNCAEWWAFELLSIVASTISEEDFTIHIFALNLSLVSFTIGIGFGLSTAILVGREFGRADIKSAIKNFKLIFFFGMLTDLLIVIILFVFKNLIFEKLIGDADLADKAKTVLILYDLSIIFDLIQYIFSSFFRGIGKQLYASGISFFNYYIFQFGLAIFFVKVMDLKVVGIWLAVFFGSIFSCVIYLIVFLKLDLNAILEETQLRLAEDEKLIEDVAEDLFDNENNFEISKN